MSLWKKTPEEIAAREAQRREEQERREADRLAAEVRRRAEEFATTPAGQARAARTAGATIFQIALPLSHTVGRVVTMASMTLTSSPGAYAKTTSTEHASVLDSIEGEGWRLEHAGYVYRITGSVSRDKLLSSGQQEAVSGEIVGIYVFRAQA